MVILFDEVVSATKTKHSKMVGVQVISCTLLDRLFEWKHLVEVSQLIVFIQRDYARAINVHSMPCKDVKHEIFLFFVCLYLFI